MNNKVGIVTITDYQNLGNILQNYSIQEILKDYGKVKSIIRLYRYKNLTTFKYALKNIRNRVYFIIKLFFRSKRISNMREINFVEFNKFIDFCENLNKNTNFTKLDNKYDAFVIGSN